MMISLICLMRFLKVVMITVFTVITMTAMMVTMMLGLVDGDDVIEMLGQRINLDFKRLEKLALRIVKLVHRDGSLKVLVCETVW